MSEELPERFEQRPFTSYCVGLVSLYALADFLHRANRPGFEMTPKSWTI